MTRLKSLHRENESPRKLLSKPAAIRSCTAECPKQSTKAMDHLSILWVIQTGFLNVAIETSSLVS